MLRDHTDRMIDGEIRQRSIFHTVAIWHHQESGTKGISCKRHLQDD
jgi:hypothetical protein